MMTMVDKYLATEMFKFNSLSQFSIALFIYHGGWLCDLCQGQSIQGQDLTIPRSRNSALRPRPRIHILSMQLNVDSDAPFNLKLSIKVNRRFKTSSWCTCYILVISRFRIDFSPVITVTLVWYGLYLFCVHISMVKSWQDAISRICVLVLRWPGGK